MFNIRQNSTFKFNFILKVKVDTPPPPPPKKKQKKKTEFNQGILHLCSKFGDSSFNGRWVIMWTSKWLIHRHTDAGDDNTRRPKLASGKNSTERGNTWNTFQNLLNPPVKTMPEQLDMIGSICLNMSQQYTKGGCNNGTEAEILLNCSPSQKCINFPRWIGHCLSPGVLSRQERVSENVTYSGKAFQCNIRVNTIKKIHEPTSNPLSRYIMHS